jgi:hypothetical protein
VSIYYGIVFDWNQIKHLSEHEEIQEKAKDLGFYDLHELWYELGFTSVSPYYDSPYDERVYVIGIQPQIKSCFYGYDTSEFKEFLSDAEKNDDKIKQICERYNLPYIKPKLLILGNVC